MRASLKARLERLESLAQRADTDWVIEMPPDYYEMSEDARSAFLDARMKPGRWYMVLPKKSASTEEWIEEYARQAEIRGRSEKALK